MELDSKKLREFLLKGDRTFLPHISVDCVIFGFHDNQLKVLLLKWRDWGTWCVPGGFVMRNESLDDSAKRTLTERTGLENIFLQTISGFWRSPARAGKKAVQNNGLIQQLAHGTIYNGWLLGARGIF